MAGDDLRSLLLVQLITFLDLSPPPASRTTFLDYIDTTHSGLKDQASKLADVLPYGIDAKQVLSKLISDVLTELRSEPMEELL